MKTRRKTKQCAKRRLRCEPLEGRQLLHGGGFGDASIEDRVEGLFEKLDGDSNGQLSAAEVSEGVWSRLSAADGVETAQAAAAQNPLARRVGAFRSFGRRR